MEPGGKTTLDALDSKVVASTLRLNHLLAAIGELRDDPEAFKAATGLDLPPSLTAATAETPATAALTHQQVEAGRGT